MRLAERCGQGGLSEDQIQFMRRQVRWLLSISPVPSGRRASPAAVDTADGTPVNIGTTTATPFGTAGAMEVLAGMPAGPMRLRRTRFGAESRVQPELRKSKRQNTCKQLPNDFAAVDDIMVE